jgi:NAD(P)-dependent dehydrogenase (short-subunit alcohol dehydrogenase family)
MLPPPSPTPTGRPVALVTGAARRIGREIALDLARHGFDLAVHCRHSRAEAEATALAAQALGARAEVFTADLADETDCRALVPAVVARLQRLDAVVNNASTFEYDAPQSFSYAAMDRHLRANTGPAILLAQALHDHLQGREAIGCVVNLSDQKLWNLNPDYFSYTLSKAALEAATVMLAQALAPQVRVCGVAPGLALGSELISDPQLAALQGKTPLGSGVTPGQIAQAVRFLIQAPSITGTTIVVDAGSHLSKARRDFAFMGGAHA